MSKKLTFQELAVGDHFIAFPTDGDDSGHGGYRSGEYVFRKMPAVFLNQTATNCHRVMDQRFSHMPDGMEIFKVVL